MIQQTMSNSNQKSAKPFIIWTLQRTGGTNLTQRLIERSGLPFAEHEPFNPERQYGDITKQWRETKDQAQLVGSIQAIIARQEIIKHCVEMVPWAVTAALADASVQADYQHLFLYREASRDRLLSLHFAQNTGVWGPKGKLKPDAEIEKIPVTKLVQHEQESIQILHKLWQYLTSQGISPLALSYEELYKVPSEQAITALLPLLNRLHLSKDSANDKEFSMAVIGRGDQGTRDKYQSIAGVDELEQALLNVDSFKPNAKMAVLEIHVHTLPNWILKAQIDTMPQVLLTGQAFDLGGVIVLDNIAPTGMVLNIRKNSIAQKIFWGKASRKIAKIYPNSTQAATARFKTGELKLIAAETLEIYLQDTNGDEYPLFKIALTGAV